MIFIKSGEPVASKRTGRSLWKNTNCGWREKTVRISLISFKTRISSHLSLSFFHPGAFTEATLVECGLINQEGDRVAAFANDEPLFIQDPTGAIDSDSPERRPSQLTRREATNTVEAPEVQIDDPVTEIVDDFSKVNITDSTEMKIRYITHECPTTPDDGQTYINATRICVYAVLPSGVSPRTITCRQDPVDRHKLTFYLQINKHLTSPSILRHYLLNSTNDKENSGVPAAAQAHCDLETVGKEDAGVGFFKEPHEFNLPESLHVEAGFRDRNDLLHIVDHKKNKLLSQEFNLEDVHGNVDKCNVTFCFFLAYTDLQLKKKKETKLLGANQVARSGKSAPVLKVGSAYGDFVNAPPTPTEGGTPGKRPRNDGPGYNIVDDGTAF